MGVSTDVWRARIGAFLPVSRSLASHERRSWPRRKLFRTYKRPPTESPTHHVTVEILLALLLLALACLFSRNCPFDHVKQLHFEVVFAKALVLHLGETHPGKAFFASRTWHERLTLALRIVFLALLLLSGDVESNPGPRMDDPETVGARCTKVHKIERTDTHAKFGTGAASLRSLWIKIRKKWHDLQQDNLILTEDDGTEISDESYFQALDDKTQLYVRLKEQPTIEVKSPRLPAYTRVGERPLTDDIIHEIATNRLTHNIAKLGLAMSLSRERVSKYELENATEPRVESRGTERMILEWRRSTAKLDQVGAFCTILQRVELGELADDLSRGHILSKHKVPESIDLIDLQEQLRKFYVNVLCFVRTIPWKQDSDVPINDGFSAPSLFHRLKSSKRPANPLQIDNECTKMLFFSDVQFSDKFFESENMNFLHGSYNDIFKIKQNNDFPNRIIITGHPGVGKSTLLYKLAHDWAVNAEGSELKNKRILIHLSLKGVSKNAMLGDEVIKQLLPRDSNLTCEQIEASIRQNSNDAVVLLDGFDESDFAFQTLDKDAKEYGSLFAALTYNEFRSCTIVVTTRTWKEDKFRENLFNPYAEIVIKGFVSIDEFIERYCNFEDAGKVKQVISTDFFSIRPLLRVPLFLAMVCETVSHNKIISRPFTRTNLMMQLCEYLYKTYQEKSKQTKSKSHAKMREWKLEQCLAWLGKLAEKSYIINTNTQSMSEEDKEMIDISLQIGFLSTKVRTERYYARGSGCFFFFHGLLRDLCVAHHLVSQRAAHPSHEGLQELFRIEDYEKYSLDVIFFECGILSGTDWVRSIFRYSNWRRYNIESCTTDFLMQCYFEGQTNCNMAVDIDIFNRNKQLFIDMNTLNNFAATYHFLLHNSQSQEFYFTSLTMKGENYSGTYEETSMFGYLKMHILKDLLSSCCFLTSITLVDCAISCTEITEPTTYRFRDIKLLHIQDCKGQSIFKHLLYYLVNNFRNLQTLVIRNITDINAEGNDIFSLCDIIPFLLNKGPTCYNMQLGNFTCGEEMYTMRGGIYPSLQELSLADCRDPIDMAILLAVLAECFPSLHFLMISNCHMTFDHIPTKQPGSKYVTSTANLAFMLTKCRQQISMTSVLQSLGVYFPYVKTLQIGESLVTFQKATDVIRLEYLEAIYLKHCLQHVDVMDVISSFLHNLDKLPIVVFNDCSLRFTYGLSALRHDVFDIMFHKCILPNECITQVMKMCKRLNINVNDQLKVELFREDTSQDANLIAHFHSNTLLNINDVPYLPGWFPDLNSIYFYNALQVIPIEVLRGLHYPSVKTLTFTDCSSPVNVSDAFSILFVSNSFPNLDEMSIRKSNISLEKNPELCQRGCIGLKTLEIDECGSVDFQDVVSLVVSWCPTLYSLKISDCELRNKFNSPLAWLGGSASEATEHTESHFLQEPSFSEYDDQANSSVLLHQKSRKNELLAMTHLHNFEVVVLSNCKQTVNLTSVISILNFYLSNLPFIIFSQCPLEFTSEVQMSDDRSFKGINFEGNCILPSRNISWLVKSCGVMNIRFEDESYSEIFMAENKMITHLHSKHMININNVSQFPIWFPDLHAVEIHNSLDISACKIPQGRKFYSVRSVAIVNENEAHKINTYISWFVNYCPNLRRLVLHNCEISIVSVAPNVIWPSIQLLTVSEVNQLDLSHLLKLLASCPFIKNLECLKCKFLHNDQIQYEIHRNGFQEQKDLHTCNGETGGVMMGATETGDSDNSRCIVQSTLERITFQQCHITIPIDVTVIKSCFPNATAVSFNDCKLSYTTDTSCLIRFEYLVFVNCSFDPGCLEWIKRHCDSIDVQVDGLRVSTFFKTEPGNAGNTKSIAKLYSNDPINIHDAPNLDISGIDANVNELIFFNILDIQRRNPLGTLCYTNVKLVHFCECTHVIHMANIIPIMSICIPNVKTLCFTKCEVTFTLGSKKWDTNIEELKITKCKFIHIRDVIMFISSFCPSVKYISARTSDVVLDASFCDETLISCGNLEEVYLYNCKVPDDFVQLIWHRYPFFNVNYFTKDCMEGHSNCDVEWSLVGKQSSSPLLSLDPVTLLD